MNKYTKRNKKTKIWQMTATEIEEPKKETEYSKAKKNWRNYILKKKNQKKKIERMYNNPKNNYVYKEYNRKEKTR